MYSREFILASWSSVKMNTIFGRGVAACAAANPARDASERASLTNMMEEMCGVELSREILDCVVGQLQL